MQVSDGGRTEHGFLFFMKQAIVFSDFNNELPCEKDQAHASADYTIIESALYVLVLQKRAKNNDQDRFVTS